MIAKIRCYYLVGNKKCLGEILLYNMRRRDHQRNQKKKKKKRSRYYINRSITELKNNNDNQNVRITLDLNL
jgi:hypothetical protein